MTIFRSIRRTNKVLISLFIFFGAVILNSSFSQDSNNGLVREGVSKLFQEDEVLPIKLKYSNKEIRSNTNDTTYLQSEMAYQKSDGSWKSLAVELRARGNFRRKNCYFTPIKLKIKKASAEKTLFEGNKKLKLVLPCFSCKNADDYVIKEYMAYKLYELVSTYHFKTRLVSMEFTEIKGNRTKSHQIMGILIEDVKKVANRHDGKVFKRHMKPMSQDPLTSVQNALFQFMIANTDFSTTYQHNQKQLFANGKILPIPYDFDMSGFVNSDYAVVSKVQNRVLPIEKVTDRLYKGFERERKVFESVRQSFLKEKSRAFQLIEAHRDLFKSQRQYAEARDFISGFYRILENEKRFSSRIVGAARKAYTKRKETK